MTTVQGLGGSKIISGARRVVWYHKELICHKQTKFRGIYVVCTIKLPMRQYQQIVEQPAVFHYVMHANYLKCYDLYRAKYACVAFQDLYSSLLNVLPLWETSILTWNLTKHAVGREILVNVSRQWINAANQFFRNEFLTF